MYEAFFGLRSRPFSPLPRVETYIPLAPVREPFESLVRCIAQEQGIGVLTAPSGSGKSLVCRMLQHHFHDQRRTVLLTTARFPTRRALLQAILFELKHPFIGLSEQEARLRVLDLLHASPAPLNRMLLIVDEAHLLSPRGLEELRTLTDYEIAGRPCVSLVLSGQLELEELLTQPDMNAFNQRVGCHVCIEPLTFEESAQYLRERLRFSGNDGLTIFTPEAIQLICSASEGNPRRLNQLSDHSLLLAYAEEERPVDESVVRAALLDLRELPLHWNAPLDLQRESEGNPLAAFAELHAAEEATLDNDLLAEGDADIEEDPAFDADDTLAVRDSESSVFEVGSPLSGSPIDLLFQATEFLVPGESSPSVETPFWPTATEATTHPESHAFETAPPAAETVVTDDPAETKDDTVSMETVPGLGFEFGGASIADSAPQSPSVAESSVRSSAFEELVVDDAYARIDRQLESSGPVQPRVRQTSLCPTPPVCAAAPPESTPVSNSHADEASEVEPVLLESQILDFINEISAEANHYRQLTEAARAAVERVAPTASDSEEVPRPRHQSLRQSLNWQFDVVEPESADSSLGPAPGEQSIVAPIETPPAAPEVESAHCNSVPTQVAPVTDEPGEPTPLEERRYAQLFTRLQRQRRRVETVMVRERRTGAEAR